MRVYSEATMEKAMTRQEVILRAYAKKISWIQAAEILGISARHLRRIKQAYEERGFHALFDGRLGKASPRRAPITTVEEVLRLYREEYFDFNVRHFHECLIERHQIEVSYTWTKCLLQGAGLVAKERVRKPHHKRRARRPLSGMLLHIDGSQHQWFGDERWFDLIVILDDASSEIYYAQLVGSESTRSVMVGIRSVIETKGVFCALYSDRASHFFVTPKAGEAVDRQALTQVGRALRELGIQLIPAYSPQARGRSERSFRTWQGRLPQELRIRAIDTLEAANEFLQCEYIREFNGRFTVPPKEEGTAFVPCLRTDLDRIFAIQTERIVNRDNTVKFQNKWLQIDKQAWRGSLSGCRVMVYQHFDETISLGFGSHLLGRYSADGESLKAEKTNNADKKQPAVLTVQSKQQTGHLIC
jgi:transposase